METVKPKNGWSEYEALVLYRLDKLDKDVERVKELVTNLRITAGIAGAAGGVGVAVLAALLGRS